MARLSSPIFDEGLRPTELNGHAVQVGTAVGTAGTSTLDTEAATMHAQLNCATLLPRDQKATSSPLFMTRTVGSSSSSSSSDDDGCDSDVADFVEMFQADSDDGELPPQSEPEPEPEPHPEGAVARDGLINSPPEHQLDEDGQLAIQLQRWLPERPRKPCHHAPMEVSVRQVGVRCTGGWVWGGAKELDAYLLHSVESFAGLRVLELGAGVGWLAQRLASVGARVVATEQPAMLPTLQLNVAKNNALVADDRMPALECCELDWLDVLDCTNKAQPREPAIVTLTRQIGGWDLIVGSDCVYMQEFFGMCIATAAGICSPCVSGADRLACVNRSTATHNRGGGRGISRHMPQTTANFPIGPAPQPFSCHSRSKRRRSCVLRRCIQ